MALGRGNPAQVGGEPRDDELEAIADKERGVGSELELEREQRVEHPADDRQIEEGPEEDLREE